MILPMSPFENCLFRGAFLIRFIMILLLKIVMYMEILNISKPEIEVNDNDYWLNVT